METAITVRDLCLNYKTMEKRSLRGVLSGKKKKVANVEALKNVSFEVPRGEILGIVGSNGSGKSTLLRALAGLMAPNAGTVDLHGQTVSLLSLGTGFIGDLSGEDNIILSGLSMGFSLAEIREKYNKIVSFSELGDAIARPVKTYSSGMYSKLAFSIAITLETDILLVDEVLSVGDLQFQKKSHAALERLIRDEDRTVLIVSHNLGEVKRLCTRVMWLEKGEFLMSGDTEEVLTLYHKKMAEDPANVTYLDPPVLRAKVEDGKIVLSWKAVDFAEDYRLYRKENIPGSKWSVIADGCTALVLEDVPPSEAIGYLYTIRARATNRAGNVWSDHKAGVPAKLK